MQDHMFISSCDGALHDTRDANWTANPLRPNYRCMHAEIKTVADLKATLRAGKYTSIGSYPVFFITSDGGALSFDAVNAELRSVIWSIENECDDGWRVIGCDINYEDNNLYCDHTGERIESAHAD